ncbi:MAG: hypothetical protein ACD_79C01234G0002 [uncultured bacterium]|nr:MAG: hypothetical protein ACD_79C01234G0002 [uncultured bacterium]
MKKKTYIKPLFRIIGKEAQAAQCIAGWAPTAASNPTCASGPAANFMCNAGNWADTQCYSGFNAIGPSEPSCNSGNAAGSKCSQGTSAGNQTPSVDSCSGGFSPIVA